MGRAEVTTVDSWQQPAADQEPTPTGCALRHEGWNLDWRLTIHPTGAPSSNTFEHAKRAVRTG